jgi:hypothetical protein
MANNLIHSAPVGITGDPLEATLKDANDDPVDLTDWDDLMIVCYHPNGTAVKFTAAVTKDPDQVANPGVVTYAKQASDVAAAGEFPFRFTGTDPNGDPQAFPTDDDEDLRFGTFVVY